MTEKKIAASLSTMASSGYASIGTVFALDNFRPLSPQFYKTTVMDVYIWIGPNRGVHGRALNLVYE